MNTFIIAEAGVNHNGSLKKPLNLLTSLKVVEQMQLNFRHLKQIILF